jgi:predicted RNA-binding protein YlxR (DUF448 family)
MRSIERRFNKFNNKNPGLSTYINFSQAIKGQKFSKDLISRWFNRLVEKEDYDKKDKRGLIDYLVNLSNHSKTTGIEPKLPQD